MMIMCSVCETRVFHCVDYCNRNASSSSRGSSAADYSLKFGGEFFNEKTGKQAIIRHLHNGECAEEVKKELILRGSRFYDTFVRRPTMGVFRVRLKSKTWLS